MRKLFCFKPNNFSKNHQFIVGIVFGLIITLFIPEDVWTWAETECPEAIAAATSTTRAPSIASVGISADFEPRLNLVNKPMAAKKVVKNIIRPRYYSSELGIREKLFIGVMTAQENINTLATAFNKTAAHLTNRIKYFINADNVKSNFKLKNIVGFTDTRESLRPFHVLKYIADTYLNDYDYFLLSTDELYVDVRNLMKKIFHVSISFDVYMGNILDVRKEKPEMEAVFQSKQYCDISAGILFSSSVIKKIRSNLDWCVRNAVTNVHSLNIGKCVLYSSQITGCQESFQGVNLGSYKLNTPRVHRDLHLLQHDPKFNEAIFIYPTIRPQDFYTLHTYFSHRHLDELRTKSLKLELNAAGISNGTISNDILQVRWPLGVPESQPVDTRHDILPWIYLNRTHQFMPDHERNTRLLSPSDLADLEKVMNRTISYAGKQNPKLEYLNMHSAYKRFDPVRGMDYQLHLIFWNRKNGDRILKSYEIVKPLGRVEIVTSPYVTESTRIALILPILEHQIDNSMDFLDRYNKTCMANHDNTFLMLVFLYGARAPNTGDEDIFGKLKKLAIQLSATYENEKLRVAWLSIRLPEQLSNNYPMNSSSIIYNSIYGTNEILSLVVIDLALIKIGLKTLVMLCSNDMTLKPDFLNRVRMNTIQGFQVFSPIGFMMYPCNMGGFCKECDSCDVSQSAGYFDKHNTDVIAFHGHDYVEARKAIESSVPIVRNDSYIDLILARSDQTITTVLDMFIKSKISVHILRAIEPNLRFGGAIRSYISNTPMWQEKLQQQYKLGKCTEKNSNLSDKCIHLASRKQIGDALVKYEDRVL